MDGKILITGATGRVGRHLVNSLIRGTEKVRILVRDKMTEFENVEVFYGDIQDKEAVQKAVEGVDIVFHLAAVVDPKANRDIIYDVNVTGTKNILESFKGVKFIYLSSSDVLGKNVKEPINEDTPYNPANSYAKTKMEAEKLVRANGGITVRAPEALVPKLTEYDHVYSKLLEGKMPVIGDGKNFLDFIHISDLINALIMAKERGRSGDIYNVSAKDFKTQNEFLQIVSKYLNVEPPKKHVSAFSAKMSSVLGGSGLTSEYIDKIVRNRTYDLTKAKNELGFEPKVDMDACIKEMTEDFLNRVEEEQKQVAEEKSEEQS